MSCLFQACEPAYLEFIQCLLQAPAVLRVGLGEVGDHPFLYELLGVLQVAGHVGDQVRAVVLGQRLANTRHT